MREFYKRRPYSLKFKDPGDTVVIHFTGQRKDWAQPKSYFAQVLADTAVSRFDFNIGQIQCTNTADGALYLTLCVAVAPSAQVDISTLVPNLTKCCNQLKSQPDNVLIDANSILNFYQITPSTLVQAILLTTHEIPAHFCVFQTHPQPNKSSSVEKHINLILRFPVFVNSIRRGVFAVEIPYTLDLMVMKRQICGSLKAQVEEVSGQEVMVLLHGAKELLPLSESLPFARVKSVLVKTAVSSTSVNSSSASSASSGNNYGATPRRPKVERQQGVRQQSTLTCVYQGQTIGTIRLPQSVPTKVTMADFLYGCLQNHFGAFSVSLKTPIQSRFCTFMKSGHKTRPSFSTKMTMAEFSDIYSAHPYLKSLSLKERNPIKGLHCNLTQTQDNSSFDNTDFLRHLLANYATLQCHQLRDPKIQEILTEVQKNKQPGKSKGVSFACFENILFGRKLLADEQHYNWKPVIPQSLIVGEVLDWHLRLHCAPPARVIKEIKAKYFFQQGLTADFSLEELTRGLIPCYRCLLTRPTSIGAPLYMETQAIGLKALGLHACSFVLADVFYLAQQQTPDFKKPYVSVLLCGGCRFLSLCPIASITARNLARHLLDFCQLAGKIQTVLISDAASTQVGADMKELLKDFQLIHMAGNTNIHQQQHQQQHQADLAVQPVALNMLTQQQKSLLYQDFQKSQPPLLPPILTHHPVSYKASLSEKESSLGALDNVCRQLKTFMRKFVSQVKVHASDHVDFLLASFTYYHNFCKIAPFTNQFPADLHLGIIRSNNIQFLNKHLRTLSQPQSSPVREFQAILKYANMHRQSQLHAEEEANKARARQLRIHGQVLEKSDVIENIRPLRVLYIKSELKSVPKMNDFATVHGPCIVVSVNPNSCSVYVFGLLSGQLMKKSYRQIKAAFSPQMFNLPLFQFFCKEVQFRILENGQRLQEEQSAHQLIPKLQKMILNLHHLLMFLSPMLPSREQAIRKIDLENIEDDEDTGDEDDQTDPVIEDQDKDKDMIQDKGQVKFTTDNPTKPQTKTLRIKDAYKTLDTPLDKDIDEDKDKDTNDPPSPYQTGRESRDNSEERNRQSKYGLRRQPQPKKRFSAIE